MTESEGLFIISCLDIGKKVKYRGTFCDEKNCKQRAIDSYNINGGKNTLLEKERCIDFINMITITYYI